MTASAPPGLLRWERRPPIMGMSTVAGTRGQHVYLVTQGPDGYAASYNDHWLARTRTRFIAGSQERGLATLAAAQAACEADLALILGRRH